MTADCFLDANILLYAHSAAPEDSTKRQRALELIRNTRFALSGQVLQEFIANALRKKALGLSEANIDTLLQLASLVPVAPISLDLILLATTLCRKYQTSPWDATVLAAARQLGCHTLYSENLNHGQTYDGVKVINPFLEAGRI